MSHFSVLVIGGEVERQLQPYHEYECTGVNDEYVVDVDVTDKLRSDHLDYGKGQEFAAFVASWGDYTFRQGRYYQHTNPNAKWDWWVVGGRWTGALKLRPNAKGVVGRPGLMTEASPPGYADQAVKGDVDFEQMRNDAEVKARLLWRETRRITGGLSWDSWGDTLSRYPDKVDEARREYREQPAIEMLTASGKREYSWQIDDDLALDEAIYIQRRRDASCVNFAFVRDGQWTERGQMGWFAVVTDEISQSQWNRMFNDMLDALPDDVLLTIVDCHI